MILILLYFVLFISMGCTSSPKALLIGKWKTIEYKTGTKSKQLTIVLPVLIQNRVEFLKDGTLIADDMVTFKYIIIDNERLEFDTGIIYGRILFNYKVSTNELELFRPEAEYLKLHRIK